MRQEHPLQQELPNLPEGGPVPQQSSDLVEMSELAKLQADALPLGLVRELRPVFVHDPVQAKAKTGNAARQARLREKRAAQGLVMAQIPREIADAVKAAGGDWSNIVRAASGDTPAPSTGEGTPPTPPAAPEWVTRVEQVGGLDAWVAARVHEALASRPTEIKEVLKEVEVRVEVPKPLTKEQTRAIKAGQTLLALTGWRAMLARWLLGM